MSYYIKLFVLFIGLSFNGAFAQSIDLSAIKEYMRHVAKIPMNHDVHILDSFVEARLKQVVAFGSASGLGNSTLSESQMTDILFCYLDKNPNFYTHYENHPVTQEDVKKYIDIALQTAKRDENVFKLYSLAISLLADYRKNHPDATTELQMMYDSFTENYKTNGGCFQGVRNRMFVLYLQYICLFS